MKEYKMAQSHIHYQKIISKCRWWLKSRYKRKVWGQRYSLRVLLILILFFMLENRLFAYDFIYDGIRYTIVSENDQTAEVAASNQSAGSDGPSLYKGDIVIPSIVYNENRPYSVVGIGYSAFVNCVGITSVTLPNTLKYISKEAFNVCMSLKSITIPPNVESIGYDVFSITSISVIRVMNPIPASVSYNAFLYPQTYNNCVLYVPYGSKKAYQNASEWNKFQSIIEMDKEPDMLDGHECVDLGLPSGKLWATMNYGASKPEEYGSYVSWSESDIISSSWGTKWITPSREDIKEIESNCSWTWGTSNGVSGYIVTGGNGNTIFLPAAGYKVWNVLNTGPSLNYWSSTKNAEDMSYILSATESYVSLASLNTIYCQAPIRPVSKEGKVVPPTTYTLSIKATGYGSASYDDATIRNMTSTFTVNEGSNAIITFKPDNGYKIKSLMVNNSDVTTSISNNQYVVSNIKNNTNVEVEFGDINIFNGIRYKLNHSEKTAEVTFLGDNKHYEGVVVIPESINYNGNKYNVTNIGQSAFGNCSGLISITIPNSITSIGDFAFEYSSLTSITIPNSVTSFGACVFDHCSMNSITVSNGNSKYDSRNSCNAIIETVSNTLIAGCKNTIIPQSVTSIGDYAFYGCSGLITITIPNSVTSIGNSAFRDCGDLTSIEIPSSVISIEGALFEFCNNLTSVTIPNSITRIGGSAFNGCSSLNSITIPNSVTSIDEHAFSFCSSLKSVISEIHNPFYIENNVFGNISSEATLQIPKGTKGKYSEFSGWIKNFKEIIEQGGSTSQKESIDGHEYVDLGLTSGKCWSIVNYGAEKPEDAGLYMKNSSLNEWGDYWRTPTKEEMQELIDECEWTWTEQNGKNGFIIKGRNNNSMFLPAAGYYDESIHNQNKISQQIGSGNIRDEYINVNKLAYYHTSSDVYFVGNNTEMQFSNNSLGMTGVGMLTYIPIRPISTVRNESAFTKDGIIYTIVSSEEKTVKVAKGNYGKVLDIPQSVTYPDKEWSIIGIDDDVFLDNEELSAIIWNPEIVFANSVSNPNLLLYVKSANYAPATIKNVIVNNMAENITLIDAANGNNFYCPQEFTAKSISYTHHYKMETGVGESKGWETIALPFDVQKVSHQSKGEIVPFVNWKSGDSKKPFWLMQMSSNGWTEAYSIKAYMPYIISMPNHTNYKDEFKLNGNVTFSAENVKIGKTENLLTSSYNGKTFVPNFSLLTDRNCYALNVNNDYIAYQGEKNEGSVFFIGLRDVHPFEAYMTTASGTRAIAIDDDLTTGIGDIAEIWNDKIIRVYNLSGQLLMTEENKSLDEIKKMLSAGVYIVNGKKIITK